MIGYIGYRVARDVTRGTTRSIQRRQSAAAKAGKTGLITESRPTWESGERSIAGGLFAGLVVIAAFIGIILLFASM